jgi:hypothetical protein
MPMQNSSENIATVLSVVGFHLVLHDFSNWGTSEIVVNVAATKPTKVTTSIYILLSQLTVALILFRFSPQNCEK